MTRRRDMLPNFLIIGAEKAATTWLARSLAEHPSVLLPFEKELFFFSSRFDRGIDWYADHFREWSGEARVGEATPVYLSHPDAPRRIRDTLGEIDLIVSLRHPVDRAYSAYWHNLRHGRIAHDRAFQMCLEADACEIRSRGDYARHLGRYLGVFPRDRLLVLRYERIQEEPARELKSCLAFLGVDPEFRPTTLGSRLNEGGADLTATTGPVRQLRQALRSAFLEVRRRGLMPAWVERRVIGGAERVARRAASVGPRARTYEPLLPTLRAELYDRYYREDVARLEGLLGLDLSSWRAPGAPPTERGSAPEALVVGRSR